MMISQASSGVVWSMRSNVKPALLTIWLSLPYFLWVKPVRWYVDRRIEDPQGTEKKLMKHRYLLDGSIKDLLREVVCTHIASHCESFATCCFDLVDDELSFLLIQAIINRVLHT